MTQVLAIGMMRDEADLAGYVIEHVLAEGVDRIVIADNRSVDGTRDILDCWARTDSRVTVVDDPEPTYFQAIKMTALARHHASAGDWIVPVDADEVWHALSGEPLAKVLSDLDADVAVAHPYVHVPHPTDDPDDRNPFTRIRRRMGHPERMAKVAFRWQAGCEIDMGNHAVFGAGPRRVENIIAVRHFQWRTLDQVARKAVNGTAVMGDMSPNICAHWRMLAAMTPADLKAWWDEYCGQPTVDDPAPWRS